MLTTADRRDMQADLERDIRVLAELAERIGRDELGPSNLVETPPHDIDDIGSDRDNLIADRVLRRRLLRGVLRHARRAARLAELLLDLSDGPAAGRTLRPKTAAAPARADTRRAGRR